jgi:formylglycine-generating enzyme required for sulfatase activity/uncharacterized caspase-like protein
MRIRPSFWLVLLLSLTSTAAVHAQSAPAGALEINLKARDAADAPNEQKLTLYTKSKALVIGMDHYDGRSWPTLSNGINDAEEVAKGLLAQGFEVTLKKDLKSDELDRALKNFFIVEGDDPDARLLFWFAGHGDTIDGEAYVVPVDAPSSEKASAEFRTKAISLRRFGEYMREAKARHVLAIFDSCFGGSVFNVARALAPPAITLATTQPVREFISSCEAGQQTSDDGSFRKLFLDALTGREPAADVNHDGYITGTELALFLQQKMTNLTANRQTPRYGKLNAYGYDRGDFVFQIATGQSIAADESTRAAERIGVRAVALWGAFLAIATNAAVHFGASVVWTELLLVTPQFLSFSMVIVLVALLLLKRASSTPARAPPGNFGARVTHASTYVLAYALVTIAFGVGLGYLRHPLVQTAERLHLETPAFYAFLTTIPLVVIDQAFGAPVSRWWSRPRTGTAAAYLIGSLLAVEGLVYLAAVIALHEREPPASDMIAPSLASGVVIGVDREGHAQAWHGTRALSVISGHDAGLVSADILRSGASVVTTAHDGSVRLTNARAIATLDAATSPRVSTIILDRVWRPYGAPIARAALSFAAQIVPLHVPDALKGRRGRVFKDCTDCPEMVEVGRGMLFFGSPVVDFDRNDAEGPRRLIDVSESFAVGRYEVTFAEWDACMADRGCGMDQPSDHKWGRDRRPVIEVTWNGAKSYVAWLSAKTGHQYTLLSEAQWEYVARAGSTTRFFWGNDIGINNANCNGCGSEWDNKQTAPVGSFQPNAFGLYDAAGNVWEWMEDCWSDTYGNSAADKTASEAAACGLRVIRGGSWNDPPRVLRTAARAGADPRNASEFVGFRVARTLAP